METVPPNREPLRSRQAGVSPRSKAAGERRDVGVTHAGEALGSEGRAHAAAAVADDGRGSVGGHLLDLQFEDAARQMHGAGGVASGELVGFANVDEQRPACCCSAASAAETSRMLLIASAASFSKRGFWAIVVCSKARFSYRLI